MLQYGSTLLDGRKGLYQKGLRAAPSSRQQRHERFDAAAYALKKLRKSWGTRRRRWPGACRKLTYARAQGPTQICMAGRTLIRGPHPVSAPTYTDLFAAVAAYTVCE
jgi:hypothetical protein